MEHQPINNQFNGKQTVWLRRIWGALPLTAFFLLVGIVIILQSWITSQGEVLKEQKTKGLKKTEVPTNVVALALSPGAIRERINLPGVVHPWVALKVVTEVRGKVVEKQVAEGQRVKQGQILALIDPRDYQNAFASAQASHRAAKAAHARISTLFEQQVATRSQMDDADTQLETTKAAMDNAALNLERCEIRSPLDGVVDRLPVEVGQFLNDGDPVADILQMDRVKVEVSIPESDVDAVRRLKHFTIGIDALNGRTFEGEMHYLSKSADSLARSYRLEIAVNNTEGEILPDMFARVEIIKRQVENTLAVPLFALVPYRNTQTVYVADAGHARRMEVRTGIQEGWQVQVVEGLEPGAEVIVVGQRELGDGAPVKVMRTVTHPEELNQ